MELILIFVGVLVPGQLLARRRGRLQARRRLMDAAETRAIQEAETEKHLAEARASGALDRFNRN